MIDPNLQHPRVQQYSIGIQHDFKGTVFEARYVGNHVVGAYRAFDFNQVVINQNGFLQDFLRAQKNGFLAQAAGGGFNPGLQRQHPGQPAAHRVPQTGEGRADRPQRDQLPADRAKSASWPVTTRPTDTTRPTRCRSSRIPTRWARISDQLLQLQLQLAAIGSAPPHEVGPLLRGELHLVEGAERCRWRLPDRASDISWISTIRRSSARAPTSI